MKPESKILDILGYLQSKPIEQLKDALRNNDYYVGKIKSLPKNTNRDRRYQKEIINHIDNNQVTVFESPPGSGKTRIATASSLNFLNQFKSKILKNGKRRKLTNEN